MAGASFFTLTVLIRGGVIVGGRRPGFPALGEGGEGAWRVLLLLKTFLCVPCAERVLFSINLLTVMGALLLCVEVATVAERRRGQKESL